MAWRFVRAIRVVCAVDNSEERPVFSAGTHPSGDAHCPVVGAQGDRGDRTVCGSRSGSGI